MADWTVHDVPDLGGKTVVVTGANSGLGLESAKVLARNGARVVLACRSMSRGDRAKAEIASDIREARLHVLPLDLQDLASVATFAETMGQRFDRVDVLLNNAGVMGVPRGRTRDGFELHLGTNHLGHFALTGRLLDLLRRTPRSRVVTVSSTGHRMGALKFDDLGLREGHDYSPMKAYGRSKLANLLFAYELQRRFEAHGLDCISVAAHPGAAQTNLGRHIEGAWAMRLVNPLLARIVPDAAAGALPQLRAAVDPSVHGGDYYGPGGVGGMRGHPVRARSNRASYSTTDAEELWRHSERLTGVRYAFE